jgi:hypothetical protein
VVGGFEPLLQKMADLVEHLPIVVHPATSQPLATPLRVRESQEQAAKDRRVLHFSVSTMYGRRSAQPVHPPIFECDTWVSAFDFSTPGSVKLSSYLRPR